MQLIRFFYLYLYLNIFQLILYLPDSVEMYGTQLFNMETTLFFALTFFILVIKLFRILVK